MLTPKGLPISQFSLSTLQDSMPDDLQKHQSSIKITDLTEYLITQNDRWDSLLINPAVGTVWWINHSVCNHASCFWDVVNLSELRCAVKQFGLLKHRMKDSKEKRMHTNITVINKEGCLSAGVISPTCQDIISIFDGEQCKIFII